MQPEKHHDNLKSFQQIILDEYFEPVMGKALRVTIAFVGPLLWGMATGRMDSAVWMAITAQVLSNISIRGSYPLKLLVLSGVVLACAACAALGTLAGNQWWLAGAMMMVLAFLAGFVRQSGDHGPGITIAVLLLYLLCVDHPGGLAEAAQMFGWVAAGGVLALVFTLVAWAFVPFSPFRRSIALTWKALAEWLQEYARYLGHEDEAGLLGRLDEQELALRHELSTSMELLSRKQAIAHARQNRYSFHLIELRRLVSAAGNALSSLRTAAETIERQEAFPRSMYRYALENLAQTARRLAIAIINHRPEDVYTTRLGLERTQQGVRLLIARLEETLPGDTVLMRQVLADLERCFREAYALLEKASAGQGNMTMYLRNFLSGTTIPQRLPWVKFEFSGSSFTFRFSLRLALAMGLGMALYAYFHIPHGYWIAMTTMIILQPEFGATITKAFNRTKGTVLGAIAGSLIFMLPLPLAVNIALVVVCSFLSTVYILRNYAVAAFFITVMVIALFHLLEPVTWTLGGIRVLNTLGGAGLAMLAGYAFWPLWERYRAPALLGESIRANRAYLDRIMEALTTGGALTFNDIIRFRRDAEIRNNNAFLSLRRMEEEPDRKQHHLRQYLLINGYGIRATRLMNALYQDIGALPSRPAFPGTAPIGAYLSELLRQAGAATAEGRADSDALPTDKLVQQFRELLKSARSGAAGEAVILELLERISREVIGLHFTARQLAEEENPPR